MGETWCIQHLFSEDLTQDNSIFFTNGGTSVNVGTFPVDFVRMINVKFYINRTIYLEITNDTGVPRMIGYIGHKVEDASGKLGDIVVGFTDQYVIQEVQPAPGVEWIITFYSISAPEIRDGVDSLQIYRTPEHSLTRATAVTESGAVGEPHVHNYYPDYGAIAPTVDRRMHIRVTNSLYLFSAAAAVYCGVVVKS